MEYMTFSLIESYDYKIISSGHGEVTPRERASAKFSYLNWRNASSKYKEDESLVPYYSLTTNNVE